MNVLGFNTTRQKKKAQSLCLLLAGMFLFNGGLIANVPVTLPQTLPAHQGHITLQPNINLPLVADSQNRQDVANQCGSRCCIYNNVFYSEGAVIVVGEAILLQCARDPNVAGANALSWTRIVN